MLTRTFMSAVSREYVHAQFWQSTVVINCKEISAVDFKAGPVEKAALYDIGHDTTLQVLPRKLHIGLNQQVTICTPVNSMMSPTVD